MPADPTTSNDLNTSNPFVENVSDQLDTPTNTNPYQQNFSFPPSQSNYTTPGSFRTYAAANLNRQQVFDIWNRANTYTPSAVLPTGDPNTKFGIPDQELIWAYFTMAEADVDNEATATVPAANGTKAYTADVRTVLTQNAVMQYGLRENKGIIQGIPNVQGNYPNNNVSLAGSGEMPSVTRPA